MIWYIGYKFNKIKLLCLGGEGTATTLGVEPESTTTELKSPISLVHEIALKRNLHVQFEVVSEKGQPHMRTFVTRCQVGDKFQTIGEGNGKKVCLLINEFIYLFIFFCHCGLFLRK